MKYTNERNAQILIDLLKKNNIRRVIISPGTSNVSFAGSLINDNYFEKYSAVDERSAAYMACGICAETGEPVVLSCTGATSSRNYLPALTEAYYRKLPVLAVTSSQRSIRIGHNIDQVTDRTLLPRDVVKISIQLPCIYDKEMDWACMINSNKAIHELRRNGGGPVHINLETNYDGRFDIEELPLVRKIDRYTYCDIFPVIQSKKIAILVGSHRPWSEELISAVDMFCQKYNAIVICDHTSNYQGKYKVLGNAILSQNGYMTEFKSFDLIISIGDISAYKYKFKSKNYWRVNPDGEIRDTYKCLTTVFECEELYFFKFYIDGYSNEGSTSYYKKSVEEYQKIMHNIPEYPFSNFWVAKVTCPKLPIGSSIHFAIRNSFRAWNYFEIPRGITAFCNTGGFGIDGCVSSMLGASFCNRKKIYYCVVGDLAFFYDLNSLGNRHVSNNVRIILINNGTAMEMQYKSNTTSKFEDGTIEHSFMAASGHFGKKSPNLVKNFVENLGFLYYGVNTKEEYINLLPLITSNVLMDKPLFVEIFTRIEDEQIAYTMTTDANQPASNQVINKAKDLLRSIIK